MKFFAILLFSAILFSFFLHAKTKKQIFSEESMKEAKIKAEKIQNENKYLVKLLKEKVYKLKKEAIKRKSSKKKKEKQEYKNIKVKLVFWQDYLKFYTQKIIAYQKKDTKKYTEASEKLISLKKIYTSVTRENWVDPMTILMNIKRNKLLKKRK
ncbi:MAG: hypothetical protein U9O87_01545 [Verrucomicrobiota bacterium]|nr:hypothetical protein [Verrucomicrobiota bacterium]